jgi:hypothetical protein
MLTTLKKNANQTKAKGCDVEYFKIVFFYAKSNNAMQKGIIVVYV